MSNSARELKALDTLAYNDKLRAISNSDEILKVANNWIGEKINHKRNKRGKDIVEFARGNVQYKVGENGYIADVVVGTRSNCAAVLYDIVDIYYKKITESNDIAKEDSESNSLRRYRDSAENNIPQSDSKSNSSSQQNSDRFNDTDYLSAVERGDMKTAQKMVEEAAEKAG